MLVNRVPPCPRTDVGRCCLLAMTGTMTHFSPTESFIKCPKYQGCAPLPFPACDQPHEPFHKEGQRGSFERFSFLIWIRWLMLLSPLRLGDCTVRPQLTPTQQHHYPYLSHEKTVTWAMLCASGCLDLLFALHLTHFVFKFCLISWFCVFFFVFFCLLTSQNPCC